MFRTSLVVVLLGTTLILASPVQNNEDSGSPDSNAAGFHRVNRSILGFIADWLLLTDQAVNNIFDRVKQPVKKVFNIVIQTSEGVIDYGKQKAQNLLSKYYEIKSKSEEKLNNLKNAALSKVVGEFQNVIDALTKETNSQNLDKLKEKTKDIAESSKGALEELQKQLEEAIDAEKKKLEESLDKWKNEADEITNKKDKH